MRYLYSLLFYLALPFAILRLWWRSRRQPGYRQRVRERLGFYPRHFEKSIWVHAVSVGEVVAAYPLIKALQASNPAMPIVVTTMTPTGASQARKMLGETITHLYAPYDMPGSVQRFLTAIKPVVGVVMETELWPNIFYYCHQRHIPICLMNARLSEKSARGYQRIGGLTRQMLQCITVIAAHAQADADRFISLGVPRERVQVTGSIKFDVLVPAEVTSQSAALRSILGRDRFVWIAASTHQGEDEMILAAHKQIREKDEKALLILVPRHPDRFAAVAALCEQSFATSRRSQQQTCHQETAVYLGDTMGELLMLYGAADVAFVGGSLLPHGGHNVLEPGVLGKPIITGPYMFNFADIVELLKSGHALIEINDQSSLAEQLIKWMQHPEERKQMGQRAIALIDANRGALAKQLDIVNKTLLH